MNFASKEFINKGWSSDKKYCPANYNKPKTGLPKFFSLDLSGRPAVVNESGDETWRQWLFIAGRAYEDGDYSYERDKAAQHEVFLTRESRLVPMQSELLLKRREEIAVSLEDAMLRHLGGNARENGYFWDKNVTAPYCCQYNALRNSVFQSYSPPPDCVYNFCYRKNIRTQICDETWRQWLFIAGRAYEDGEYSYEKDKAAQNEVFLTRENNIIECRKPPSRLFVHEFLRKTVRCLIPKISIFTGCA